MKREEIREIGVWIFRVVLLGGVIVGSIIHDGDLTLACALAIVITFLYQHFTLKDD